MGFRGHESKLFKRRFRLVVRKFVFSNRVINSWNSLPVHYVNYNTVDAFYRAMLCIRGTSHGPVSVCLSVCLSVTSRCSTKTAKRRITQTTSTIAKGL